MSDIQESNIQNSDALLAKKYLNKINDANGRGIEFTLSFADFKKLFSRRVCTYTGVRFDDSEHYSPTIDRIDNSLGYVKGNVQLVSNAANRFKNYWESGHHGISFKEAYRLVNTVHNLGES